MNQPEHGELELSLFGAGIGECLVVHLGSGMWMVVDSCMNADRKKAIALEYLEGLGVDVATQVKLIVITHWHDDHIQGAAQILRQATSARFACSGALNHKEFFTLLDLDKKTKLIQSTSSLSEFADVFTILTSRAGSDFEAGPDHWASDGMVLYSDSSSCPVEVRALSPSAQTITDTKGDIASLISTAGEVKSRFHSTGPNGRSVVLLVTISRQKLLLGADLEKGGDKRRGWQAVLCSGVRPKVRSSVYKVAHHGSSGAHLDDIWDNLLISNPCALVTPYARGSSPLPTNDMISHLAARTNRLYCTAWPPGRSPSGRDRAVERMMRRTCGSRRATRKSPGHIRLRCPIAGSPEDISVDLFGSAMQLPA